MTSRFLRVAIAATVLSCASCSNAPVTRPPATTGKTYPEVALLEQVCIARLQTSMIALDAHRMDVFFSAALNGLVNCESSSGLSHVPTKEVTRWLIAANGKPVPTTMPKSPVLLAKVPTTNETRLPYQRACTQYMRRYIPASVANAGDDPDVAAAFIFNALEECDSDSGFATIEPRDLAAIMQSKHLL